MQITVDLPIYEKWLGAAKATDTAETIALLKNTTINWLIVDHYGVDAAWELELRPFVDKIMVIDDLANRAHDCELLLDQNLGTTVPDYDELTPASCRTLLGPEYALLAPVFGEVRSKIGSKRSQRTSDRILITMGGVDKVNVTSWILKELKKTELPENSEISVVMGKTAPWIDHVRAVAKDMPWPTVVDVNVNNMAERMAQSDIGIGAAGSTSWERCCLGLPTVLMVLAENQRKIANALEHAGAAYVVDLSNEVAGLTLQRIMKTLLMDRAKRAVMSSAALKVCDGNGVERVISAFESIGN